MAAVKLTYHQAMFEIGKWLEHGSPKQTIVFFAGVAAFGHYERVTVRKWSEKWIWITNTGIARSTTLEEAIRYVFDNLVVKSISFE